MRGSRDGKTQFGCRGASAFSNSSGCCSPPVPNLLPPHPKPIGPEVPAWLLVMLVGFCRTQQCGFIPPQSKGEHWGSCLCTPLPKGKVSFGCIQWRVWLNCCPHGWILLALPCRHATMIQLDPSTHWKALAYMAMVVLALGPWWDCMVGLHGWRRGRNCFPEAGWVLEAGRGQAGPGGHHLGTLLHSRMGTLIIQAWARLEQGQSLMDMM